MSNNVIIVLLDFNFFRNESRANAASMVSEKDAYIRKCEGIRNELNGGSVSKIPRGVFPPKERAIDSTKRMLNNSAYLFLRAAKKPKSDNTSGIIPI